MAELNELTKRLLAEGWKPEETPPGTKEYFWFYGGWTYTREALQAIARIPKGETVSYENLVTDHIVVKGCLKVLDGINAKSITGSGIIYAGSVSADDIRVDDLEAASVTCKRLIAKRVQTPQLIASESAAVSCYLAASYVETGKLTVAASEICEAKAEEIIHLTPKKRTLFGLLPA